MSTIRFDGDFLRKWIITSTIASIATICLAVVLVLPILAQTNVTTSRTPLTNSGTGGLVYLNLPPPPNSTSGTPTRPSDIQLRPYHIVNSSYTTPHDAMLVYLWIPQRNSYNPVALITTGDALDVEKAIWNGTFVWYNTSNPASSALNIVQVPSQTLQISTSTVNGEQIMVVNLTSPVHISLPFNLWTQPTQTYGNLTFDLAPLTLTFRPIASGYPGTTPTTGALPSGWIYSPTAQSRTPAWVEIKIPSWLGATSPLEVVGHIDYGYLQTFTPPA